MQVTREPDLTLRGLIHDLNNVFQTLVEAADVLSSDPAWSGVAASLLRSVERGKEISASLQGHQPSAPIEIIVNNARTLLEDSLALTRGPAIEFCCELEPGLVLSHAWAWERVMINLFSNAVRAMPEGGTIFVRAEKMDRELRMVVADSGCGIAQELLPRIFEPNVSTRRGGGLGLHIVHSIVTQAQGAVRAANRPDCGAEFVITLPMKTAWSRMASA